MDNLGAWHRKLEETGQIAECGVVEVLIWSEGVVLLLLEPMRVSKAAEPVLPLCLR